MKVVYRHLPLPNHQYAVVAAEAAEAAGEQGKFWEMADRLFADQAVLSEAKITEIARSLGLDRARFNDSMVQHRNLGKIAADVEEARRRNLRGTPTFFVGQAMISGAPPWEKLKAEVDKQLQSSK